MATVNARLVRWPEPPGPGGKKAASVLRIVIDLQACQTPTSRQRGIGRYSMSLAIAMARQSVGKHEIWLALNGNFPEPLSEIRERFAPYLPPERIVVFHVPRRPAGYLDGWRARASEIIRERILADLKPDVVHLSSLFEGSDDDATTSTGTVPTAVTLYDVIPLLREDVYLTSEHARVWYFSKINQLREARSWLAISERTRDEAVAALDLPGERVVNISAGSDACFIPLTIPEGREQTLRARYGLNRPFIMYTGGTDGRKNVRGLIEAFSLLADHEGYQLAIVCSASEPERHGLLAYAATHGLDPGEVVVTGYVPDDDLVALYNLCHLFVFPSFHEGFGLPALEAMACGAPVIGSNASSTPEVIGREDALFDPGQPSAIADAMATVLTNEGFRRELREHGLRRAALFTWDASARRALAALERLHGVPPDRDAPSDSGRSGDGEAVSASLGELHQGCRIDSGYGALIDRLADSAAADSFDMEDLKAVAIAVAANNPSVTVPDRASFDNFL